MENAEIKFINRDTNREITIEMHYDETEKTLDYNTTIFPELPEGENGGLALFLANMFLNMLQGPSQDNAESTEVNAD